MTYAGGELEVVVVARDGLPSQEYLGNILESVSVEEKQSLSNISREPTGSIVRVLHF